MGVSEFLCVQISLLILLVARFGPVRMPVTNNQSAHLFMTTRCGIMIDCNQPLPSFSFRL